MADDFRTRAYEHFIAKGYAPHQAKAMVAHAIRESGGNTTITGDKGTSFGTFQWHDTKPGEGRWTQLQAWAKANNRDPNDLTTQLDFADYELQTSEKAAGDRLKAAKTEGEASDAMYAYLRPAGWNTGGRTSTPGVDVAMTATPTGGGYQEVIAGLLAKQQEQAAATAKAAELAEEAKQLQAMKSVTKEGMGLLGAAETAAPPMAMPPAAIHRPQVQPVALGGTPDFATMLARQRLMRRA